MSVLVSDAQLLPTNDFSTQSSNLLGIGYLVFCVCQCTQRLVWTLMKDYKTINAGWMALHRGFVHLPWKFCSVFPGLSRYIVSYRLLYPPMHMPPDHGWDSAFVIVFIQLLVRLMDLRPKMSLSGSFNLPALRSGIWSLWCVTKLQCNIWELYRLHNHHYTNLFKPCRSFAKSAWAEVCT